MAKKIVDMTAKVASDYVGEIMEMTPRKLIERGEVANQKTSPNRASMGRTRNSEKLWMLI